jgi:Sulfotransferase family
MHGEDAPGLDRAAEIRLPSDLRSPIFIGGQRRSGTSLFRVLLNRHPRISAGPESKFVQDPSFMAWNDLVATTWPQWLEGYGFGRTEVDLAVAAMVDNIFTRYQLTQGKARWAEKTPTNILRIDYLFRLFPHAQFVHVIRDPRDTYCSIRQRMLADKPEWKKFRPRRAARDWCAGIAAGKPWRSRPDRYLEIRYEDLVAQPEQIMRHALAFLGESWDPRILSPGADNVEAISDQQVRRGPVDSASVGRWREELDLDEISSIQRVAGEMMIELGYEPTPDKKAFRHLKLEAPK